MCRYCGHHFPEVAIVEEPGRANWRIVAAAFGLLLISVTSWLIYDLWRDLDATREASAQAISAAAPQDYQPTHAEPEYEQIQLGSTFEWVAKDSPGEVIRKAGPYHITIRKKAEDDLVRPVVTVANGSQSVTLEGEMVWPTYGHKISYIQNRRGAGPAIMLQSFSGGAHCCTSIQLAGYSGGKLKVLDLGSWDGDTIDVPTDVSGDGVVDFVMHDNSFLYAFASYADSYAPPKILNVIDGEVKDVSSGPAFRSLFAKEMRDAGQRCRPGLGMTANGACPAFVAAAARVGHLERAWAQMLAAYDATADWDLPTGCLVSDRDGCPEGAEIVYKSYPEALLAFLKREGYIAKSWLPPEAFRPAVKEDSGRAEDWTT